MRSTLQKELGKRNPFDSVQQEATLAILRTSDLLENRIARLLREHNLTLSQYNVLRILRGEGQPMPCLEIAARMIQIAPAITRVIDQLLKQDFITKTQSEEDRRIFHVQLTAKARTHLKRLDAPIMEMHSELLQGVPESELRRLIKTLEQLRSGIDD